MFAFNGTVMARELKQSPDAIPVNAITLTDAYELVLRYAHEHPEILKFDEDSLELLEISKKEERKMQDPEVYDDELESYWHRSKEVNLFLRKEIEAKELVACVRDPEIGETLQLKSDGWVSDKWEDYVPPGIWSNYIDPHQYDSLGPDGSYVHGALRPVFFRRGDFDRWFQTKCLSEAKRRPGRPPGTGSWAAADQKLVAKMRRLIKRGEAKSALDAARMVVSEAKGRGTEDSKISRLAKRYAISLRYSPIKSGA